MVDLLVEMVEVADFLILNKMDRWARPPRKRRAAEGEWEEGERPV